MLPAGTHRFSPLTGIQLYRRQPTVLHHRWVEVLHAQPLQTAQVASETVYAPELWFSAEHSMAQNYAVIRAIPHVKKMFDYTVTLVIIIHAEYC